MGVEIEEMVALVANKIVRCRGAAPSNRSIVCSQQDGMEPSPAHPAIPMDCFICSDAFRASQ